MVARCIWHDSRTSSRRRSRISSSVTGAPQSLAQRLLEQFGLGWLVFLAKVGVILFAYIWTRWTLPRYRYDQLMHFGWKFLLPLSVINLLVTAALVLYLNG